MASSDHALLSASGAHRWLNCPPSARLESGEPESTSAAAEQGTVAHALAEWKLRRTLHQAPGFKPESAWIDDEMETLTDDYVAFVQEHISIAQETCGDPQVLIEQRLDFSHIVPGGFGTGDCVIIAEPTLQIIDLKYGQGVLVEAANNPQLMLYALGALHAFGSLYDIEHVAVTIYQPRWANVDTWEISVAKLEHWAETEVKPKAELAAAGEGEFCSGSWCQFCKIAPTCRARAEANLQLARLEFAPPAELSDTEIADVLTRIPQLKTWASDVEAYALSKAVNQGVVFEGFKLVAGRTGRFAGRLVQVQNLPRNYLTDLDQPRTLVRGGDLDALELLYDSVPDTLSQLIRTAFIPSTGHRFIVADFSAIEARVIAWLAGETTTLAPFREGKDLYCETASRMFGVPVEKHGINSDLRQKGKVAVLACIAEGQQVLTDHGLVPIEEVTAQMRVWDGTDWVAHEGVIYKGEKHVITYQGLTSTPDHLVWVQGQPGPIPFGQAAASGAHLLQTGDGRHPIRLGRNHQPAKTLVAQLESLLRRNPLHKLRHTAVDGSGKSSAWGVQGLPAVFGEGQSVHPALTRPQTDRSQATLHESIRSAVAFLWRAWHRIPIRNSTQSRLMDSQTRGERASRLGTGSNRHQRPLREGQLAVRAQGGEHGQPSQHGSLALRATLLALLSRRRYPQALTRKEQAGDHQRRPQSRGRETQSMAIDSGQARVYDLLNAGEHHRYTVSGHLVHNCGYGGSIGALKAMGALGMGLAEHELKPIVDAWRQANPHIVGLWADVEEAAIAAITSRQPIRLRNLRFSIEAGILFIELPSGRRLAYVQPRLGENKWGGTSITYTGTTTARRWGQLETYGGKLVENIVQAIARDLLVTGMHAVANAGHKIVMHVHDEIVIDEPADSGFTVDDACALMSTLPVWAKGLPLDADGYGCDYYRKD